MSLNKETIRVMNVNIYCEYNISEKPPLILIHGYLSSTYTFHRIMSKLSENYSVIAIDLPGFGRSEKSKSFRYSFENYAQLIKEVMDYFHITRVTLVGHSMGGQVSLNVAKFYPEKVSKLILLNSSGYLKRANQLLILSSYLPFSIAMSIIILTNMM
ncbi:alpha/beta fold hydrolase [Piscibacillus salipiscarius]|uniref:alpha/beta fold hydrolase n=1 Tax=Piscibacillus salipiscarius TaxID=299480 RepID=UPI002436C9CF|nr:alpha/beta hydrolase [Piscibacillus salipiscarius]